MRNMWQTGVANARLEFSGEARFQIFRQKWLLGNIKYVVSFKLKSLKSIGFPQLAISFSVRPKFRTIFNAGKKEKSPLHGLFPVLLQSLISHM